MNLFFHLYNRGDLVICRRDKDYISANNKIAVAALSSNVKILAFCLMSTHMHIIAEAIKREDIETFVAKVCRNYSIVYSLKYGERLGSAFTLSCKEIEADVPTIKKELSYVIKNPVHHNTDATVFSYRFGVGAYLFADKILTCDIYDAYMATYTKVETLSPTKVRNIASREVHIPDDWLISSDGMIYPGSFVAMSKTCAAWWNNPKKFLEDMAKDVTDSKGVLMDSDAADLRISRYNDTQVCEMIDKCLASKNIRSIHFMSSQVRSEIRDMLVKRNIPYEQIRRCMWL